MTSLSGQLAAPTQAPGAKLRRQRLCDELGIGRCTGGSLVTVLNRFVSKERFDAAFNTVLKIEEAENT